MYDPSSLYSQLVEANLTAFRHQQFMVSYHALSAAMYCALAMKNSQKLEEVVALANEQVDELGGQLEQATFQDEPVELSLYRALIQVARTRLLLFRK